MNVQIPENAKYHSGWISPTGEFFPCPNRAHASLARSLYMATTGRDSAGAEDYLCRLGWMRLESNGQCILQESDGSTKFSMNANQYHTFKRILEELAPPWIKKVMCMELEMQHEYWELEQA